MLEKGCQLAFNLDGGQSSTIVFMGEQICTIGGTTGKNASARRTAESGSASASALSMMACASCLRVCMIVPPSLGGILLIVPIIKSIPGKSKDEKG